VVGERGLLVEGAAALVADVGLLARVDADMLSEVVLAAEALAAVGAQVRLLRLQQIKHGAVLHQGVKYALVLVSLVEEELLGEPRPV